MCGLALGGWLNDAIGWRWTFFAFAAPGILFVLILSVLPEPARQRDATPESSDSPDTLPTVIWGLVRQPCFLHLAVGMCLFSAVISAVPTFAPANAMRRFGLSSSEVGLIYGISAGAMGIAGSLFGGILADRAGRGLRKQLVVAAAASIFTSPVLIACWLSPSALLYFALLATASFVHSSVLPPTFSVAQTLGGHAHRAVAIAVLTFSMYAVGGSLGAVITGMISDTLTARYGVMGLSYSLSIITLGLVWAGGHFYYAARRAPN
jgi:predicted MFS family arabinose efflux permease